MHHKNTTQARGPKIAVRNAALIACMAIVGTVALTSARETVADQSADSVKDTREALHKWVTTKRIISQEKRDWALGREMLNERIDLVQREIDQLKGKVAEAEASITDADLKRAEMLEENDRLKSTSFGLLDTAIALEASTKAVLSMAPDPIRERVKPLSQRFPEEGAETKLSLAERYQNVIGVLNELNKFHREITVVSEVRTLANGSSVEVTTMYLGLGQAYYVGGNGTIAGVGAASPEGWVWKPADDKAPEIARAFAIHKNEQVASFVHMPIEIK